MNFGISPLLLLINKNLKDIKEKFISIFEKINIYYFGHRRAKQLSKTKNIKLDLGSSGSIRKEFIGIDLSKGAGLRWDLTWGIPFLNDSVDEIRSDHFFEHLKVDDLLFVLSECYRVLKKGSKLDFTVPHIDPYLKAYLKKDMTFLKKRVTDIPLEYKSIYNNPHDILMWLLYRNGDHKISFDRESIINKIKHVGFKSVKARKYNKKRDINKRFSSVYITAIK